MAAQSQKTAGKCAQLLPISKTSVPIRSIKADCPDRDLCSSIFQIGQPISNTENSYLKENASAAMERTDKEFRKLGEKDMYIPRFGEKTAIMTAQEWQDCSPLHVLLKPICLWEPPTTLPSSAMPKLMM